MRVAFYAPLKPPDDPTPSGDRLIARLFMQALKVGGHTPVLASRFRSRDPDGTRGAAMRARGAGLADRCLARFRDEPPDAWLTYHLYYKAPDWIGPTVARTLRIPYLVAEASVAPKRAKGPWAESHRAVVDALAGAAAVLALTRLDMECLAPALPSPERLMHFPPFLDTRPFVAARAANDVPVLLAVGMMRADAKLASYRLLADALRKLIDRRWHLRIAGDGPARAEVEAAFAPVAERVTYLGAVRPDAMPAVYAASDLLVWPAVDEAFGMALLEAQAAGTPAVAGGYGGVPEVIDDGTSGLVTPPGDAAAFAQAVAMLLDSPARLAAMSVAARLYVRTFHDLTDAARRLDAILSEARNR